MTSKQRGLKERVKQTCASGRLHELTPALVASIAKLNPKEQAQALRNLIRRMISPQSQTETWDNNWVTVFGFPATVTQAVIQHFSHFGTIVDRRLSNQGNWVHLRYQGRLECHKALANNGRVLLGRIMVGVLPCKDKKPVCRLGGVPPCWIKGFLLRGLLEFAPGVNPWTFRIKINFGLEDIVGDRSSISMVCSTPMTPDAISSPRQLTLGSPAVSSPLSARTPRPLVQAYKIAQADSRHICISQEKVETKGRNLNFITITEVI
ncbi:hypothetical protein PR048_032608 [Dryococelus australis]|uniref:Nucleoporin NUP35 n=1 Tax=Dryococelus australis TaxID=614101 RepID=A0ABQ9G3U5_9NEOP|nr:hypothetical protein PR048_032608 [Dryococelus australis]